MVTDGQVKELWRLLAQGKTLAASARMTEMDEKTARGYRDDKRLPSQRKSTRKYRTRIDPFEQVWSTVEQKLQAEPRLQAKTVFDWLQETYPGKFLSSMRRTFERRVAKWRALSGPGKTVYFPQQHQPGRLAASDFTNCNELGVTIAGMKFDHLLFHCVLTYSNVDSVSLCFSESFEALSEGIQNAFWEFGGVPQRHRTDSLSAAVLNHSSRSRHTERYAALMQHYGTTPEQTNARCANENGDVESSNGHLKDRIEQALLLRGSRDFNRREDYLSFVKAIIHRGNLHRQDRFLEDQAKLMPLPDHRLETDDFIQAIRVSLSSTIVVRTNIYSVPSRLIGSLVDVRIGAEQIIVTHHDNHIQTMKRLVGKNQTNINFRHVIDSLVRKPGAFANYRYRQEMFPTTQFRIAYDMLCENHSENVATKKYLQILELAARQSLEAVVDALRLQIASGEAIEVDRITLLVQDAASIPPVTDMEVEPPSLSDFDSLLHTFDKESPHEHQTKHQTQSNSNDNRIDPPEVTKAIGDNDASDRPIDSVNPSVDRAISLSSLAELPRPLPLDRQSSPAREPQSSGVSLGVDHPGMRGSAPGASQALNDSIQTPAGKELGIVPVRPTADASHTSTGNASRRIVLGPTGECINFWQTGLREEPCLMRTSGTTGATGTEHDVYDVQLAGSAVIDCQAGLAIAEAHQTVLGRGRIDHRRPGICSAEPRGDGGPLYFTGRALRERERSADEQSNLQQMGPDLQGRDDNGSGDRSVSPSQRDHRAERTELSRGNSQATQTECPIIISFERIVNFMPRNSNCR
jgi:hypothetical protein